MPSLLPDIHDPAQFERLRDQAEVWRPAIAHLAEHHGLSGPQQLFATGSAVVFAVGDHHVIKLHEPWHRDLWHTEASYLSWIDGRLPVASPGLQHAGQLEGWGYLIMARLSGHTMRDVRAHIPERDWLAIAAQVGELAAACHALPTPPAPDTVVPWSDFLSQQQSNCLAHHRAYGLPEPLLEDLHAQQANVDLDQPQPVFLHTELTDTNLQVQQQDGRWRVSGVLDFEPSMLGHPLYDLPGITIFVARGQGSLCRAMYRAYGLAEPDQELARQLLACVLWHRYSHIGFFLRQVGVSDYPTSWRAIAEHLLGF